jgi:hypothetical protein
MPLILATGSVVAWSMALGDYIGVALHACGLPTVIVAFWASPRLLVWVLALVLGLVGWVLAEESLGAANTRWWWRVPANLGCLAALVAVVAGPTMTPTTRFDILRPGLDAVASSSVVADAKDPSGSVSLPLRLAWTSANGKVDPSQDGAVFIPMWVGWRDNAGGYWYSPDSSPEYADMWGLQCLEPIDLGDGWWACGME